MDVAVEGRQAPPTGTLEFPLLQLIVEARNEHGMRQQDWSRYRRYCSTKTQRVRSALHLTHAPEREKTGKAAKGPRRNKRRAAMTPEMKSAANKGRGHQFVRREIALDQVHDTRPLELLLFEAEHSWASAEEIWSQHTDENRAVYRRHSLSRARRAVRHAEQLRELVDALPAVTLPGRAQTLAYVGLVRGALHFIQGRSEETLRVAAVTRQLLTSIAESSPTSRDEALASSFLDTLDAQIRFAAYSLNETDDPYALADRTATPDVCEEVLPGFAELVQQLRSGRQAAPKPLELHWRSQTVPVHTVELYDVVTRAQDEEAVLTRFVQAPTSSTPSERPKSQRTRLTHAERNAKRRGGAGRVRARRTNHAEWDPFDRVLSALTDAEATARELVDENAQALAKTHSTRYEAGGVHLRRAHEWLTYRLLSVRIARNVRLLHDVQLRAQKREARAQSLQQARSVRPQPSQAAAPSQKRPQPGSRAKRVRAEPKAFRRRPGRSGTHRLASERRAQRTLRAQRAAEGQAERRRLRLVPGLAKLLDGIDSSLLAIGGLVMIEGEPDVSNLLEAKRFFYCAALMEYLAQAFVQHGLLGEALILLQRGDLYIRQAEQSLELADGAEDEDTTFPPQLLGGSDALAQRAQGLEQARTEVYSAIAHHHGAVASMRASKSGQTLYFHAQRHVSFDAALVEHALQEAQAQLARGPADASADDAMDTDDMEPMFNDRAPDPMPMSSDSAPFDPANALAEEEERRAEEAPRSRGWFSGWFSRGT
ncbi:signal recognition particle subunit srp68 [Malassezia caprae]|uniref:Signal recognition particle subunit SRP68 n=1 Tax=Malassezia caprae TaxID=1381934 RepID=A0AAF0E969_9BASI|nr:signal recognition particle subunit srp68 [Malassezia caprae]